MAATASSTVPDRIGPLFTIASVLLGIRALVDINAKGDTRGIRLAWFAILFGSLMTGLWAGGMYWWDINVRNQIEMGPFNAIYNGQSGRDSKDFESMFTNPSTNEETSKFFETIDDRYGNLLTGGLDQNVDEQTIDSDKLFLGMVPIEAELEYVLQFTNKKDVHLTAKYMLFDEPNGSSKFTNRFKWFRIHDEQNGDLVYPDNVTKED